MGEGEKKEIFTDKDLIDIINYLKEKYRNKGFNLLKCEINPFRNLDLSEITLREPSITLIFNINIPNN